MQTSQIKEHLNVVFQEIESYLGFKPKCYFAGGCIASLVLDQDVKDYDVWFETLEDWMDVDVKCGLVDSRSKYATTVTLPSGKIIQFVCNRIGKAEDVVPTFDFKHTHSYYLQDSTLSCDTNFIQSLRLEFAGRLDHPINTLERLLKFNKRGYYVPFETLQQLMVSSSELGKEAIQKLPKHFGSL
jgi:hypothetical protein